MAGAWTVLDSRIGHDGGWWRLRLDKCRTPANVIIDNYPVLEYPDWVSIVALREEDGKAILTREYRHAVGQEVFGLPGGTVEPEEMSQGEAGLEKAAARELLEETGRRSSKLIRIAETLPNSATHANKLTSYLALDAVFHRNADIDEEAGTAIGLTYLDLPDLVSGIRDGSVIMDSGHVAAVYAAVTYLSGSSGAG